MLKVGDRVWNIKDKCIDTVQQVMYESYVLESDIRFAVKEQDLHQTADDMFKEIGFALMNQSIKGANYLQTNDCEIYPYNKDDKIQIVFYKEVEGYVVRIPLSDINGDIVIKLELHLAIHQKIIELGWL